MSTKISKSGTVNRNVCLPQHTPKTIIRKSPTESVQVRFDFNGESTFHSMTDPFNDICFRSMFGISDNRYSIWAPPGRIHGNNHIPQHTHFSLTDPRRSENTYASPCISSRSTDLVPPSFNCFGYQFYSSWSLSYDFVVFSSVIFIVLTIVDRFLS